MKESMRHVYTQAKAALQKGGENKVGALWDSIDELDEDVNDVLGGRQQTIEELDSPEAFPEEIVAQDSSVLEKAATALASYKDTSYTVANPVDDLESGQPSDWETPFSFLSTARPTSSVEITAFGLERHADDATTHVSGSEASITVLDGGSGSADRLQVQIKQLQERIKSQLRESHSEVNLIYCQIIFFLSMRA